MTSTVLTTEQTKAVMIESVRTWQKFDEMRSIQRNKSNVGLSCVVHNYPAQQFFIKDCTSNSSICYLILILF